MPLISAGIAAFLTVVAADVLVGAVYPPPVLREVDDGIKDLERRTPHVLVISSSHGRSFHAFGRELERRTGGRTTLTSVPLEGGHASAMEWVLQNRVRPLVDRNANDGGVVKAPLRDLIFGITWWDTCRREPPDDVDRNLVSRGWRWRDFWDDVAHHGVRDLNRNFLRVELSRRTFAPALNGRRAELMQTARAALAKFDLATPPTLERPPAAEAAFLARWRADIETGHECIMAPTEVAAIERMAEYARTHNLRFTIVLFPLKPATVTTLGRKQTLEPFARTMQAFGASRGFRVIDMTESPVLSDRDFMLDYDHVNAAGNDKWARRSFEQELGFLTLEPVRASELHAGRGAP